MYHDQNFLFLAADKPYVHRARQFSIHVRLPINP